MTDTRQGPSDPFGTAAEFVQWCRRAPPGTQLPALEVAQILDECSRESPTKREEAEDVVRRDPGSWTWRERLWTVPAETRLGVVEVAEALGRPKSYVYARTSASAKEPLPHRKMDGVLAFTVGELRTWIRNHEEEIVGLPMESTLEERQLRLEGVA